MPQPRVLLTRRMPAPAERLVREAGFTADVIQTDNAAPRDEFLRCDAGADGLVGRPRRLVLDVKHKEQPLQRNEERPGFRAASAQGGDSGERPCRTRRR